MEATESIQTPDKAESDPENVEQSEDINPCQSVTTDEPYAYLPDYPVNSILFGLILSLARTSMYIIQDLQTTAFQDNGFLLMGLTTFFSSVSGIFMVYLFNYLGFNRTLSLVTFFYTLYTISNYFGNIPVIVGLIPFAGISNIAFWYISIWYSKEISDKTDKFNYNNGIINSMTLSSIIYGNILVGVLLSSGLNISQVFLSSSIISIIALFCSNFIRSPRYISFLDQPLLTDNQFGHQSSQSFYDTLYFTVSGKLLKVFVFCLTGGAIMGYATGAMTKYIGINYGGQYIGYILAFHGIIYIISLTVTGKLSDIYGLYPIMLVGLSTTFLSCLVMITFTNFWWFNLGVALLAIGRSILVTQGWTIFRTYYPEKYDSCVSWALSVGYIGFTSFLLICYLVDDWIYQSMIMMVYVVIGGINGIIVHHDMRRGST